MKRNGIVLFLTSILFVLFVSSWFEYRVRQGVGNGVG
jgi:hypothetical protein